MTRRTFFPRGGRRHEERCPRLENMVYSVETFDRKRDAEMRAIKASHRTDIEELMRTHVNNIKSMQNESMACYRRDMEGLMKRHENKIEEIRKEHTVSKSYNSKT
uniref:uncharacterized protein LOC120332029 n=1 Tax=Styela clava TaxID=7725 RepID=UPI001939326D|nr:uncharacterized protein LOC120332029 [Styela clava]